MKENYKFKTVTTICSKGDTVLEGFVPNSDQIKYTSLIII
jgi:hypothetical protein